MRIDTFSNKFKLLEKKIFLLKDNLIELQFTPIVIFFFLVAITYSTTIYLNIIKAIALE